MSAGRSQAPGALRGSPVFGISGDPVPRLAPPPAAWACQRPSSAGDWSAPPRCGHGTAAPAAAQSPSTPRSSPTPPCLSP
jgi:hypothetical protein